MAKKKSAKPRKATLDTIFSTMERGFAAVAEDIADIKSKMATKADIAAVRKEMQEGFSAVNRRLDQIIQMQLDEHAGRIKKLETAVFPK